MAEMKSDQWLNKQLTPERAGEIIDEVFSYKRFSQQQWKAQSTQENNEQLERRS